MNENEKKVLNVLRTNGSIDRTSIISLIDLANITNLSEEEAEKATEGLEKAGYIDKWDTHSGFSFKLLGKIS